MRVLCMQPVHLKLVRLKSLSPQAASRMDCGTTGNSAKYPRYVYIVQAWNYDQWHRLEIAAPFRNRDSAEEWVQDLLNISPANFWYFGSELRVKKTIAFRAPRNTYQNSNAIALSQLAIFFSFFYHARRFI